jgi:hypothetical protein
MWSAHHLFVKPSPVAATTSDGVTFTITANDGITVSFKIREPYLNDQDMWRQLIDGKLCYLVFNDVSVEVGPSNSGTLSDSSTVIFTAGPCVVRVPFELCVDAFNTCYMNKVWVSPWVPAPILTTN